jgi:hypothetical protein
VAARINGALNKSDAMARAKREMLEETGRDSDLRCLRGTGLGMNGDCEFIGVRMGISSPAKRLRPWRSTGIRARHFVGALMY